MRNNFGTKEIRENDPLLKGFIDHNGPTRALRPVDHLIAKAGIGLIQTVESHYQTYCKKPNEANAKKYALWRLRLHRRLNNDLETLRQINEARNLGLNDTTPGKTCWDCVFD